MKNTFILLNKYLLRFSHPTNTQNQNIISFLFITIHNYTTCNNNCMAEYNAINNFNNNVCLPVQYEFYRNRRVNQ